MLAPPGLLAAPTAPAAPALRTANYFLRAGVELDASLAALASYDLLVLPAEAQVENPAFFTAIRERNPDIIILAYVPTVSWNSVWNDALHDMLAAHLTPAMRLTNGGEAVRIWPGTHVLDLTGAWQGVLTNYVVNDVLHTGAWDGVFYDEVSDDVWWDKGREAAWHEAYRALFDETRERVGNDVVIVTNGSSSNAYNTTDGRMFEDFPTPWEYDGRWEAQLVDMLATQRALGNASIVNVTTGNTGVFDERELRLGLAAALMTGALLSVDYGTTSHGQLWTHPTFAGGIGAPVAAAERRDEVWMRTFTNGAVFMNPTAHDVWVPAGGQVYRVPADDALIVDFTP